MRSAAARPGERGPSGARPLRRSSRTLLCAESSCGWRRTISPTAGPSSSTRSPTAPSATRSYERGAARDPRARLPLLGGRSADRFGLWRAGWSATRISRSSSRGGARARPACANVRRRADAAWHARGRCDGGCPTLGFDRPSLAPRSRWTRAVSCGSRSRAAGLRLSESLRRPGWAWTWHVAYPLATAKGFRGSRLVAFGINTSLAYAARTTSAHSPRGSAEDEGHTRQRSSAAAGRSSRSTREERDAFLDAVRRTPAQLRALLAELDGAVDVMGGRRRASARTRARTSTEGARRLAWPCLRAREVIVHELGHVVSTLRSTSAVGGHFDRPSSARAGPTRDSSRLGAVRRPGRALGARQVVERSALVVRRRAREPARDARRRTGRSPPRLAASLDVL